ncbi:hypothetical protein L6452_40115 [Arctium lappa]|uniref:Uncharacterized protein n=1 Tax=Arctium lappa TaxID=4217 RepID=A0ACB8XMT4_ARCLA|nr:hypothetical protein L6452_40115 [Arctium lappa]
MALHLDVEIAACGMDQILYAHKRSDMNATLEFMYWASCYVAWDSGQILRVEYTDRNHGGDKVEGGSYYDRSKVLLDLEYDWNGVGYGPYFDSDYLRYGIVDMGHLCGIDVFYWGYNNDPQLALIVRKRIIEKWAKNGVEHSKPRLKLEASRMDHGPFKRNILKPRVLGFKVWAIILLVANL